MGLFLMVIYTPGLLLLVKVESPPSQFENRAFQKRPSFELKKTSLQGIYKAVKSYKKSMEQYIDEKLVVREFFLDLHLGLKSQLFHVNPQPEKVITGVDGWMFGVELDSVLRQTIGQAVLPNKAYSNIDNNIKGVSDYLNEKGIKHYFLLAPNKHSIYYSKIGFEDIPVYRLKHQLFEILEKHQIPYIDPTAEIVEKSKSTQLYFKTDTHWNDEGALVAFNLLIDRVNKDFIETAVDRQLHYRLKVDVMHHCGLSRMIRSSKLEDYQSIVITKDRGGKKKNELDVPLNYKRKKVDYEFRFYNPNKKLKVLVFRDSFSNAMKELYAATFNEVVFIWEPKFSQELVERENPDIVIIEFVERLIPKMINYNQPTHHTKL